MNEICGMDFVADALFDGRRLRALTVVDNYIRECLAIEVGQSLKGEDVVQALTRVTGIRGKPKMIKSDNGNEFISKAMDRWAYENRVELEPGRTRLLTARQVHRQREGRVFQRTFSR